MRIAEQSDGVCRRGKTYALRHPQKRHFDPFNIEEDDDDDLGCRNWRRKRGWESAAI